MASSRSGRRATSRRSLGASRTAAGGVSTTRTRRSTRPVGVQLAANQPARRVRLRLLISSGVAAAIACTGRVLAGGRPPDDLVVRHRDHCNPTAFAREQPSPPLSRDLLRSQCVGRVAHTDVPVYFVHFAHRTTGEAPAILAISANCINQAVKAIAIARGYLEKVNAKEVLRPCCAPSEASCLHGEAQSPLTSTARSTGRGKRSNGPAWQQLK